MSRKELFVTLGVGAVSFAFATLSGAVSWVFQFVITGLTYFFAGLTLNRRQSLVENRGIVALIVLVPYLLIYGGVSIWARSLQTYPIWIVSVLGYALGALAGARLKRRRNLFIAVAAYIATVTPGGAFFMYHWLNHVFQPVDSQINRTIHFSLSKEDGTRVESDDLKGRVVVLKFWATSCTACIKEFPTFDLLYKKYETEADVAIYSVNIPLEDETPSQIVQHTKGYSFPVLFTVEDIREVGRRFGIQGVPTILVLDRSNVVRYSGPLALGDHSFVSEISLLVERLRQESHSARPRLQTSGESNE
ncbi:TlpA family protein disulfide reductase [Polyangium aurulentum]|uniref:TlpA family protein disulfide reductase n=1 Tax=Polyangium aurulentum TaxID=2567896 RepID=UPI00146B7DDB|nr:TlpA disulfide reductase family protein [Polyangium aurulentum]UQA59475.1 TlpA family protein disulfide reductase [Polyangium aurulentum]